MNERADYVQIQPTVRIFAGCFFSTLALVVLRKCGLDIGDFPLIALCIILSMASHLIYAFSFQVLFSSPV